jgi:hypothetical protein
MLTAPAVARAQTVMRRLPMADVHCAQGFVWREAFAGDYVCVTSESRSTVAHENTDPAAAEPCQPGTVWREARPSDHICVALARRSAVADENRLATTHVAGAASPPPAAQLGAPCAQGFVWREAFAGDYVCVTSESRSTVAHENTDPAAAEPCQPGTVWREARPSDHVCVALARRSDVAAENRRQRDLDELLRQVKEKAAERRDQLDKERADTQREKQIGRESSSQGGCSMSAERSASLSDLIFAWECPRSVAFESFNVRVRISDGREGQVEVRGGNSGSYTERNAVVGATYTFMVQGCDPGPLGSSCSRWIQQVFVNTLH